jgi:hypothetical protein
MNLRVVRQDYDPPTDSCHQRDTHGGLAAWKDDVDFQAPRPVADFSLPQLRTAQERPVYAPFNVELIDITAALDIAK